MRHRITCFLSEEKKEGQRQNTSHYTFNNAGGDRKGEIKVFA